MGRKNGNGKAGAAAAHPKRGAARVSDAVELKREAFEHFKEAMLIHAYLNDQLDEERVKRLTALLSCADFTEMHTGLLLKAYDFNDADAIHVLLRANAFLVERLSILQVLRFLSPSLYSCEGFKDHKPDEMKITIRVSLTLKARLRSMFTEIDPANLLQSRFFQVAELQDEYAANWLLAAAEQCGQALEFYRHRHVLFTHACHLGFTELMLFCLQRGVLPDIKQTPLVTVKGHSPLACLGFEPTVDKIALCQRLKEAWAEGVELNDLCAFELFALCCVLEGVEEIKAALKAYLAGKDINAIARQLVVGEQIIAVLQQDAEVLKSLSHDDFYVIIANTQSISLFSDLVHSLDESFNSEACLQEIMNRFDRMRLVNEFRQECIVKRHAIFLSNILADIKTLDAKTLEFIVSIFIREDHAVGLKNLAEQFPEAFRALLGRVFSEDRSFDGIQFKGLTVLGVAVRNTARQVAISLYRYMLENHLSIDSQALGIFASELLYAMLHEKEPDLELIVQCLKDFPMVYCNIGLLDNLLKYCFSQNSVNQALLEQVLSVFMHYFKDPFFNLYERSSSRFSLDQLEAFEVVLGRLAGQYAVEDRQRSVVEAVKSTVKDARYLQALLQDPFKDLVLSIDKKNVSEVSCQDYFLIFGKKTIEEKKVLADLLLRHILHLHNTDPEKLKDELMVISTCKLEVDEPEAAGTRDIDYTSFALLCHYKLYYLAELCLLLCPTLDFSEPEKMEQYARPLSLLCRQGNIALARKFMNYIVTHTGQHAEIPLYLELCERRGSPVYVATQVDITVGSQGFEKQVTELLSTDYTHLSDEARLQFIIYINYIMSKEPRHTKKLTKFINSLHAGMKKTMLDTAIGLQDSLLILAALKYQPDLKSGIPANRRGACLKVLFLSPNEELFKELRVQAQEVLTLRDYAEEGYSQPMDGLSVCLAQLELALIRTHKSLVASYCRMLSLLLQTVNIPNYYLVTFLSILSQFDRIVFSEVDRGNILGYCRQVLISKSAQLATLSLEKSVLDFIKKAISGVGGTEGQGVRKFLVRSDRVSAHKQALTALQYSILSDEQLTLSCIPACHARIRELREHYPELDFLVQKDYRAVAVMIEDQGSLPENLSVLELCYILVRTQFLPKAQELIEAALRKRVLSHPDGMNVTQDSLSPMSLLIQDDRQDLVDFLLEQERLDLGIAAGELPYLAQMCDHLFPDEILEKCCRRVPQDQSLALFVTVSSPVGHSSLYRLYQMTQRKDCVEFLTKEFDAKKEHSEQSAVELLVLVRGWLADSDLKQHHKKLKSIEKSILNFMGSKQINYITSFRKHGLPPSHILSGLKSSQEELDSQIVGYDLTMLINASLSSVNLPLFRAVCVFMDRRKFLINMTQEHVWMDTQDSSTVLDKFICLLKNGQHIEDVFAMLKAVLDRADRKDAAIQESMKGLVRVSAGRLHEVFKYSFSYYGKLYPDDSTLFAEQASALLFQVIGLDDAVLKTLFRILNTKLIDELLDLLEPLEPYVLEFVRDQSKSSVKRISDIAGKVSRHKSSQQAATFKESLHVSARTHRAAVGQICHVSSQRFEEFALPETVEYCEQTIAEIKEILASLENLHKEAKRLEWYLSDDEAVCEAEHHMINTVKQLLSRQQQNISEQKEVLIQAEAERIKQENIVAEEQAKALAEQERQAAVQAQVEAEREAASQKARAQALAQRARQDQLEREKRERRQHIRTTLVEPLNTLYQTVAQLSFDARMDVSALGRFEQQVSAYRERYKTLFDLTEIENKNRFNVNKSLDACKILLPQTDRILGVLERALAQRQRDLRTAEQYRLKREAEASERQEQAEQQRLFVEQEAKRAKIEEEHEQKHQAAERAAEEQRRLAEQAAEQARIAAEAERRRQAEVQRHLERQQEEAFYLTHTHSLTAVLQARYAEKMQKSSANPHGFHARALFPDAIVAIVPRANLIPDEIGLKVVFENPEICVAVDPVCDLYVMDPRIKEGRCCVYFGNEGHGISWTVLQGEQVFIKCDVKPRYPTALALKHHDKIISGPFVPGIESVRPAVEFDQTPSP